MMRRSRLAVIGDFHTCGKRRIKDRITGEELDTGKVVQRMKEGIYSNYHVKHLNLFSAGERRLHG